MKQSSTPSEKTHALVNPAPVERSYIVRRHRSLILFKNIFGIPIPWLSLAFALFLPVFNLGLLATGWLTCILTVLYILVDRFSSSREFSFFPIGGDLPLLAFVITVIWGLSIVDPMDFFSLLNELKWILFVYLFAYTLDLFPGINAHLRLLFIATLGISLLGIYQTFTGHRFVPGLFSSVEENHFWPSLFAAHGTLEASTEFALLLSTFLPLPLSAWLLETERFSPQRMLALAGGLVIGAALLMNLRFEVFWVVLISSLLLIYMTKKKYFLLLLGPLALLWFSLDFWDFKQTIVTHLFDSAIWPWEMRQEIIDQQLKLFEGNPWLGIGFNQNFDSLIEFFSSQGIAHQGISGAPNAYFQLLITTGVLGLSLYLLYVLSSLLTTHRLYSNIPKSHYWHRVFALTSLGVQVAFHVSGLFVWTFGYVSMTYTFAFFLALSAYMAKHYEKGIVPDDQAL